MRRPRLPQLTALALLGLLAPVGVGGAAVHSGLTPVASPEDAAARAVTALEGLVAPLSHPAALTVAAEAYFRFREAHPDEVRKPYLYFVDLGLDNRAPRGWVFDMERLTVVEGPFTVAHGRGSSSVRDGVPTRFSNVSGSKASSVGLYLAEETYTFRGTASSCTARRTLHPRAPVGARGARPWRWIAPSVCCRRSQTGASSSSTRRSPETG